MNILIKLMSIVSLVIAPYIAVTAEGGECCKKEMITEEVIKCNINGKEYTCNSKAQCDSIINANVKDVNELKGNYNVDGSHSSVNFSVKHILVDTKGTIMIDSGFVNLENTTGPKIFIQLDMTSLTTQNSMRDGHLKDKENFFNVAKFKKASFEASEIVKAEAGEKYAFIAKGKLTIKGVTKDVTIPFNYAGNEDKDWGADGKFNVAGFEGSTKIIRSEYGIEGGGAADEVLLDFTLEVMKPLK